MSLVQYKHWAPTQFDIKGISLEDRKDWYVAGVTITRDSLAKEQSNFYSALKTLGGEGEGVEVHRFGHWGPGWFEIILVHPLLKGVLEEIHSKLIDDEDGVLDKVDFEERKWEEVNEFWKSWACREFIKELVKAYDLKDPTEDFLCDIDKEGLLEFYCEHSPDGFRIRYEADGPRFDFRYLNDDNWAPQRNELAEFIKFYHGKKKE